MTITIPDALPQLHTGVHEAGSGRACIMNAIAYMNGDRQISDMPSCVYPPFALMAQAINDNICKHTKCQLCESANAVGLKHNCATPLCGPCAHKVWMMGVQLIGTAELSHLLSWTGRRDVAIQIGSALVDWDVERHALQRHAETDRGYMVSPTQWSAVQNSVTSVICGRPGWTQQVTALQINAIQEAGGVGLADTVRLIQAPSPAARDSVLVAMGKRYADRHAWLEGMWKIGYGYEMLAEKLPDLVGILRRAAGHAEQADIVITPEQVAKVPAGVA